jgi:hypothetical protein
MYEFNEKARDWKKDGVEREAFGKVGCKNPEAGVSVILLNRF